MTAPDEIRTERLLLRRLRPEDETAVVEIHTDPATCEYRPQGPDTPEVAKQTLARWIAQWETDAIGYWAVLLAGTGETIGLGGLAHNNERGEEVLNLYYRFRPSAWGHGYAPEMAEAAVRWARTHRRDRPVSIVTRPENSSAVHVAEKLGFVRVAEHEFRGVTEWLFRLPDQELTIAT